MPNQATAVEWSVLMSAAQQGDRGSYRLLLQQIAPFVRALALRALRDRTEAEDAVQDVLLTLHARRDTYDPQRPFTPWLAGIARHRIVDRMRRRGRHAAREVALQPAHETIALDWPNDQPAGWDAAAMHRALAQLPAGQRMAIEMLKLREMSLREAAVVTGLTVAALKVATHRAIGRLGVLMQAPQA
jgi:RNA polymerase sigma-70 factor (ECF subfamily)